MEVRMLTVEELAYSQQKNREYIWNQCEIEFKEKFGYGSRSWDDYDQDWLSLRYEYLCDKSNIPHF